eukprot:Opistho-2@76024
MLAAWAVHVRGRRGCHGDADGLAARGGRRAGMVMAVIVAVPVMSVRMPLGCVSAGLGLEGRFGLADDQVHLPQHVGQHMVGFQQQRFRLQLQLHMAVAQVVGGAQQIERAAVLGAGAHLQHGLRGGLDQDQGAVLGHQHIAATHGGAARQEHAQMAALAVGGVEAAFL